MTLLETITKAAAAADEGNLPPNSKFPVILNADAILASLTPASAAEAPDSLVTRLSDWAFSVDDNELSDLSSTLSSRLKRKLKNPRSLTKPKFVALLTPFLTKASQLVNLQLDPDRPDLLLSTPSAAEKLAPFIGKELAASIAEACVLLQLWDVIGSLITSKVVAHLNLINLVEKIIENHRLDLLCLYAKHITDLRASELLAILKSFLSPSSNKESFDSMLVVRKAWEKEGLLAIDKASKKGIKNEAEVLARQASILLMMAHDGFSLFELGLHYVFGSSYMDSLVLSSAVAGLDGLEVMGLVEYFVKWLEKYWRFPITVPCPFAEAKLRLELCNSVPSLEAVVRGLALVLDQHFLYLVLNPEFHEIISTMEEVVRLLISEADYACRMDGILKHLTSKANEH